jgi:hypothetical protein
VTYVTCFNACLLLSCVIAKVEMLCAVSARSISFFQFSVSYIALAKTDGHALRTSQTRRSPFGRKMGTEVKQVRLQPGRANLLVTVRDSPHHITVSPPILLSYTFTCHHLLRGVYFLKIIISWYVTPCSLVEVY